MTSVSSTREANDGQRRFSMFINFLRIMMMVLCAGSVALVIILLCGVFVDPRGDALRMQLPDTGTMPVANWLVGLLGSIAIAISSYILLRHLSKTRAK
jgi:hypothetical protein